MRIETIHGVKLTIADTVRWQDPETKVVHNGFITARGNPFGYEYLVVVTDTDPRTNRLLRLSDLPSGVVKTGEL
jgi:hypothetical protein